MSGHPIVTEEAVKAAVAEWRSCITENCGTFLDDAPRILAAAVPHLNLPDEAAIRPDERAKVLRDIQDWIQSLADDPETSPVGKEWLEVIAGGLNIMRNHDGDPS